MPAIRFFPNSDPRVWEYSCGNLRLGSNQEAYANKVERPCKNCYLIKLNLPCIRALSLASHSSLGIWQMKAPLTSS